MVQSPFVPVAWIAVLNPAKPSPVAPLGVLVLAGEVHAVGRDYQHLRGGTGLRCLRGDDAFQLRALSFTLSGVRDTISFVFESRGSYVSSPVTSSHFREVARLWGIQFSAARGVDSFALRVEVGAVLCSSFLGRHRDFGAQRRTIKR